MYLREDYLTLDVESMEEAKDIYIGWWKRYKKDAEYALGKIISVKEI